jgi:hypothetical protein
MTTGPEIWDQCSLLPGTASGLPLDGFVCSTGTGGTLAGVTRVLKEKSDGKVKCWLADPPGSVLYGHIKSGRKQLGERIGSSITEGKVLPMPISLLIAFYIAVRYRTRKGHWEFEARHRAHRRVGSEGSLVNPGVLTMSFQVRYIFPMRILWR